MLLKILHHSQAALVISAIACALFIFKTDKPMQSEAEARENEQTAVNIIDAFEMQNMLKRNDVVIIDNRPEEMFSSGHILGAINLPYKDPHDPGNVMTERMLKNAAKDKIVVFYCTGNLRAYHAAIQAMKWGFNPDFIFWYKEGYRDWMRRGF